MSGAAHLEVAQRHAQGGLSRFGKAGVELHLDRVHSSFVLDLQGAQSSWITMRSRAPLPCCP
jgi:hypothetical protein